MTIENSLVVPGSDELRRSPVAAYLADLAPSSRRVQLSALRLVAESLGYSDPLSVPWSEIGYQDAKLIREALARTTKPAYANRVLAALRGVLREAEHQGADLGTTIRALRGVKGSSVSPGRAPSDIELRRIRIACEDHTRVGERDKALLLGLLYGHGLRRDEAARVTLQDLEPEGSLKIRGKGRKERRIWPLTGARQILDAWLRVRHDRPGPVCPAIVKGGRITDRPLTPAAIYEILRHRMELAGLRDLSPHDLRRGYGTALLRAGADVFSVQRLMGHSNPQTTSRYDRRTEEEARDAAALVMVP